MLGPQVLDEGQPVDDVARLDLSDPHRVAGLVGGPVAVGVRRLPARGNAQPQVVDELVDLDVVAVVQPALELVAEQRPEALARLRIPSITDSAIRTRSEREVDRQAGGVVGGGVGEVAVAKDRRGDRVVERRRVEVALVGRSRSAVAPSGRR